MRIKQYKLPHTAVKSLAQRLMALLGLRVSRITRRQATGSQKYFNTGKLNPLEENSKQLYDDFYSDRDALDDYFRGYRIEFYRQVSSRIKHEGLNLDNKSLLDVGCGTGHLLRELRGWSSPRQMAGCDFSHSAIVYASTEFPEIEFFVHDINEPLDKSFDVVICTEVLEHMQYPHVAIGNLAKIVATGGSLILTVPNGRIDTINEHINFWSPESWSVFLERECPEFTVSTALLMEGKINFGVLSKTKS